MVEPIDDPDIPTLAAILDPVVQLLERAKFAGVKRQSILAGQIPDRVGDLR